ncbi:unnamed protein product [Amoebophrya sp. A25]|nr:unnamed protein product [Amoebophrya sp. A25]|eukprot:GSA25T00009138001.1
MALSSRSSILVYGSCGSLGRSTVRALKSSGARLLGVDIGKNSDCDASVQVDVATKSPTAQQEMVLEQAGDFLRHKDNGGRGLSAVLCLSGGWAGGNAIEPLLLKNTEQMVSSSLYASLIAASVAAKFSTASPSTSGATSSNGTAPPLLLLPGAAPLLPTAGAAPAFMLPYIVAKAGVHSLLDSMAADAATAGLPEELRVFGIAPVTLDTEMNRKGMPDADFSSWTPLDSLADQIKLWCDDPLSVEHGKMYKVVTENGKTRYL